MCNNYREREREREREQREREREQRERELQKEQQRRTEMAAAKARQQSANTGIPVRVIDTSSGVTTTAGASNKENLLYPSLDRFTSATTTSSSSRPSAFTSASSGPNRRPGIHHFTPFSLY
jgi:hypothetical protein